MPRLPPAVSELPDLGACELDSVVSALISFVCLRRVYACVDTVALRSFCGIDVGTAALAWLRWLRQV